MTFTEAALEVLRSAGEPLHYKKITEIAIARNLLSHVGKTPEVTMSSRLATLVKKDRGQAPIVKVRPGVFAIRESAMHTTDKDENSIPVNDDHDSQSPESQAETLPVAPRPQLPGADVFPEEDDDDAPILAGLEDTGGGSEDRGRRRRRRRRRGGKGGLDALDAGPPREGAREGHRREGRHEGGPRHEGGRIDAGRREGRHDQGRRDERPGRYEARRDGGFDRDAREPVALDLSRQPGEGDLLGKDLADAAFAVLSRGERSPLSFARVAELLVRRGRLSGSPETLAPTVAAALRADAARAQRVHGRPRFRISGQMVSLGEWLLPNEAVRSEETVERGAEGQRDQVRRAFVGRLNDLPAAGFAEIIATWLNAEGVTALRAVRRPGSSGREFHFAGILRRGAEETRLALVVLRSGRDVDREAVVNLRGSLHHYGNATCGWMITTGRVAGQAREEAAAEGAAPCALFAGSDLARAMERLGIGLRVHFVPLSDIDFDLLESLGDSGQRARHREPERDRDRGPRPAPRAERGEDERRAYEPETEEREADEDAAGDDDEPVTIERGRGAMDIDLLDPEAAEASRLSSDAVDWKEGEDEPEADEDDDEERSAAADADLDDEPGDTDGDDERDGDETERHEREAAEDEADGENDGDDDDDTPEDLSASGEAESPEREPSGEQS